MSPLAELLEARPEELVRRWSRAMAPESGQEWAPALPGLVRALVGALRGVEAPPVSFERPGFVLESVVRGCGALQECVLGLAEEEGVGLTPTDVRTLTRFITRSISEAVACHARSWSEAQRSAQRAQREVEERLRLAMEATGVGCWEVRLDTRTLLADERVLRLLGLSPGETPGLEESLRCVPPEEHAQIRHLQERALAGEGEGRYAVEYRVRTPDGQERWLAARGQVFFGATDRAERFVGTLVDLTARRRAEDALRRSEEYLRRVVDATGVGTWEVELGSWRVMADARLLGLLGLEAQAPLDLETMLRGIHPTDRERVARALQAALMGEDGGRYIQEFRTVSPRDGRERWVEGRGQALFDASGRAERLLGTVLDITARKENFHERERLALLVERSNDLIGLFTREARPLYFNEAGRELLGLGRLDEALGSSFLSHFPEQERAHMVDTVLSTVQREGAWEGVVRMLHRRTGEVIPFYCHAFEVRDRDTGELLCVAAIARDLREQLRREEEQKRRSDFEQQLIGIVSHDLRNPLNAILLGASGLLRREGLDARTVQAVTRIRSSTERATRMVRDLLDFTQARLGGGLPVHRQSLDLRETIHQVLEEMRGEHLERDFQVRALGDTRGAWDPDRITQLLINLLINAVKYSPEDSAVGVLARGEGEAVVLEVHNTGEPMPPELLSRLFQPLQRAVPGMDMATRSVGLGLYIVDHIVRAHGGRIEVTSSRDEGTRFCVRLPRA